MIFLLTLKDFILNALTFGWWGRSQGERRDARLKPGAWRDVDALLTDPNADKPAQPGGWVWDDDARKWRKQ